MKQQRFVTVIAILTSVAILFVFLQVIGYATPLIPKSTFAAPLKQITPTITTVEPSFAFNDLDAHIIITGTNFTSVLSGTSVITPPQVYLGNILLSDVGWVSSTTLTATVPWGMDTGLYTVTVVNPDHEEGNLPNGFAVLDGIEHWNGSELFGGEVSQILMKPGDPNTLYALGYGVGLFRSRDAGETWHFVSGDVAGNADFVVDPHRPSRIYSDRWYGLNRSDDEGDTWTLMFDSWPDGRAYDDGQIYVSPHNDRLLFFSAKTYPGNADPVALGLLKSIDSGKNWIIIPDLESVPVSGLSFHPNDPQKMVLGTSDGRVFESVNNGDYWNEVTKPPIDDISVIVYNPHNPTGEVWVAAQCLTGARSLVKSLDNTFSGWVDVAPNDWQCATSIDFTTATSVYLAMRWGAGGHYSDNGAQSWQAFGPFTGGYDIAFSDINSRTMYMGDIQYGIHKTTDAGLTWEVKNQGLSAMVAGKVEVSPLNPTRLYAVFNSWPGVFRSQDAATTWQFISIENSQNIGQVRVDPFIPQRVYLASDSKVYISNDGGTTWSETAQHDGMPYALQTDPHHAGHLLMGLVVQRGGVYGAQGALYASTNYGNSWELVTVAPNLMSIHDIAFDPQQEGLIYLSTWGSGLYRSINDGLSWQRLAQDHADMQNTDSIAIATHPQSMLVVQTAGVPYRSLDKGDTWEEAVSPHGGSEDMHMFIDGDVNRLYAATWGGLYLSTDGAQTWTQSSGPLGRLHITALTYSKVGNRTILYAATTGGDPGTTDVENTGTISDNNWSQKLNAASNNLVEAGVYRFVQSTSSLSLYLPVILK